MTSDLHCADCGSTRLAGRHRSDSDHGMFWAVVERAYENWPESAGFQPSSKDHLYGWLLIEARHLESAEVESDDTDTVLAAGKAFFKLAGRKIHCVRMYRMEHGVRIVIPKSLSYRAADKRTFEDVRSKVYEIIEATLGVPIETLKKEAEREAA